MSYEFCIIGEVMTRDEHAKRRETIKRLYAIGVPTKELAEKFSVSTGYIYQIAGSNRKRNAINRLRENPENVKKMLGSGATNAEVAKKYGVSKNVVREFCRENSLANRNGHNANDTVTQRIKEKTAGLLEYVSGYTDRMGRVRVRCAVCGGEFERSYHNITSNQIISCPYCTDTLRQAEKEIKKAEAIDKAWAKAIKAYESQFEIDKNPTNIIPHICPVCGAITTKPKYCSEACRTKVANKVRDHRRRLAIKTAMVDRDITVLSLFNKSRGICAICGKPCDLNDYTKKDGYFIAGNNYPSIDHIIPLAKGGEHSWDNVQLAHRLCNSKKSDHLDV